jgi:hypothetical protein
MAIDIVAQGKALAVERIGQNYIYNAETGNLSDSTTGKLIGYVSSENNFVVPSRIAAELFDETAHAIPKTTKLLL